MNIRTHCQPPFLAEKGSFLNSTHTHKHTHTLKRAHFFFSRLANFFSSPFSTQSGTDRWFRMDGATAYFDSPNTIAVITERTHKTTHSLDKANRTKGATGMAEVLGKGAKRGNDEPPRRRLARPGSVVHYTDRFQTFGLRANKNGTG